MILREFTMARSAAFGSQKNLWFLQVVVVAFCFGLLAVSAPAKDAPPINAIALFDGANGPAYVQINGLLINAKTGLRVCDGVSKFDTKPYDKRTQTPLQGATSLERGGYGW